MGKASDRASRRVRARAATRRNGSGSAAVSANALVAALHGGLGDLVELRPDGLRVADGAREVAARDATEPRQLGRHRAHDLAGEGREHPLVAQTEEDPSGARVDGLEQSGQDPAAQRVAQRPVDPDPQPFARRADPGVRLRVERGAEDARPAGHDAPDGVAAERGHRREHALDRTEREVDRLLGAGGHREERRDRPGLEQGDLAAGDRPLDVLGRAVLRLDPPTQVDERRDVGVRERRLRGAVAVAGLDAAARSATRSRPPWRPGFARGRGRWWRRRRRGRAPPGRTRGPRRGRTSRRWPSGPGGR